jgi:hypothetical protein
VQQHDLRSPTTPAGEGTVLLVITEPLAADDVEELCARARSGAAGRPRLIVCDVGTVNAPNVAMVDALARIALTARQSGCDVQVYRASPFLAALIGLVGLADVLPCQPGEVDRG